MDDPRTEVEQKEGLLTELEARLQALNRIKKELSAQAQILRHQLLELRKSPLTKNRSPIPPTSEPLS